MSNRVTQTSNAYPMPQTHAMLYQAEPCWAVPVSVHPAIHLRICMRLFTGVLRSAEEAVDDATAWQDSELTQLEISVKPSGENLSEDLVQQLTRFVSRLGD